MFIEYNVNPYKRVGDCVVRAIAMVLGEPWEKVYWDVCEKGAQLYDMPDSNEVWSAYLFEHGFKRYIIPNECPHCYTVKDFCRDYPQGRFLLATGSHVIAVIDGDYYDTWDSGGEVPVYFFVRREYE